MTAAAHPTYVDGLDAELDELLKSDPEKVHQWHMSAFSNCENPENTVAELLACQRMMAAIECAWERAAKAAEATPAVA